MFCSLIRFILFINLTFSITNAFHSPNFVSNRSVMVHLFEWKWNDIADECERFLGPNGYAGVQVSPVSENAIVENRPWFERYQPISYKIITRSGDETEFKSMVDRCNRVGVRIYVDIVFNHMTRVRGNVVGTGGSTANVDELYFPAIPFGPDDFHHPICSIGNYKNPVEVRNCQLEDLPDLNQSNERTREKIIEFMNKLVSFGVAGFRVDAAKHMWPWDLQIIYTSLNNLNTSEFPPNSKPYIYQEVIEHTNEAVKSSEYTHMGAVTEFKFTEEIGPLFKGGNQLRWLRNWGPAWGMISSHDAFVFVDNHDNQREGNPNILNHKSREKYIMAVAFMLAHPYGQPRVMSSFEFSSRQQGPPADEFDEIISPKINSVTGQCENGWVCEHRWLEILNMIKFREVVRTAPVYSWWDNKGNQIAFCRGTLGFIVFNNEPYELNNKLFTCLPAGIYCDSITGQIINGKCTGTQVDVNEYGEANIRIAPVTVLAIHIGVKLKSI